MCCDPIDFSKDDIDGECPDCGQPTVGGTAYEQCGYSPVECTTCNWRPCDGSC
jgi:hypothetical protein